MQIKRYNTKTLGYKLALLTDLHLEKDFNYNILDDIVEKMKNEKPDYICLSGDIIDSYEVIFDVDLTNRLFNFIKSLSNISQTIVTLGNHELQTKLKSKGNIEEVNKFFLKLNTIENVYYLYNKSLVRDNLCFTSIDLPYEYYKLKPGRKSTNFFIKEIDKNIHMNKRYYNILLCHSPIDVLKKDVLNNSKEIRKTNLILSGHMHNGMVPKFLDHKGNIGFIGPNKIFLPKTARGIVTKYIDYHEINLIISGGITKISSENSKFLHKFNNCLNSEIVIINI